MLREEIISTFSDLWYRVGPTRPALSTHAQVIRQQFGGRTSYVVEDPAGGQFYRLSESAYLFIGLLDGRRTVDEAWEACNAQLGDDAPTQRECIELLSRLQLFGLLSGDVPLEAESIERRKEQAASMRLKRRTGHWIFYSIPLVNPEPWLERYKLLFRPFYTKAGLGVWLLLLATAVVLVAGKWEALGSSFNQVLDPGNLAWLGIVFLVLRAVHEIGHASACKAMGGRSTEIGVIMILLVLPLPYCDATSAWRFPEIWRRVLVSAAGVYLETFIASIAAIIWALTGPEVGVHAIAYNVMLISSVSTIVFNLNPLLRYDGYYILSDVTGTPNLAQRSRELWSHFFERHVFGVRGTRPPVVRDKPEAWLLTTFGLLSTPYRLFIAFSILMIVADRYLTIGLLLACIALAVWVLRPLGKGVGYLLGSGRLVGRRARAFAIVGGIALVLVTLLGALPLPAAGYAWGVVEPRTASPIRPAEAGFVSEILVASGANVSEGDPLIVIDNRDLVLALRTTEAALERAEAERDQAFTRRPALRRAAEARVRGLEVERRRARERVEALTVRAPSDGYIVVEGPMGSALDGLLGRWIERGDLIAFVAATDDLVIRTPISDREHAYVFRDGLPQAAARVRGRAATSLACDVTRVGAIGTRELSNESLSAFAGGNIVMDPSDPQHRTLVPQFIVVVEPAEEAAGLRPGQRAHVRFGVASSPAAHQLWRRIRQYFELRLSS